MQEKLKSTCGVAAFEQPMNIRSTLLEGISKGVKYRFLFPKRFIPKELTIPGLAQAAEIRSMEDLPFNVAMSEKEAGISFQFTDGKVDYVSFVGKDPVFVNWVKDLFLYYWDKGNRLYSLSSSVGTQNHSE